MIDDLRHHMTPIVYNLILKKFILCLVRQNKTKGTTAMHKFHITWLAWSHVNMHSFFQAKQTAFNVIHIQQLPSAILDTAATQTCICKHVQ